MYFLTHTISQFWFLHFSHSSVMQVNRSHHPCTFSANYTPESLDFINNYFSLIYLNLATLHHNTSPVQIQDLILYNALQALYFALSSGSLLDKYMQLIKDVSIYLPSAQDPTNFDADPDPHWKKMDPDPNPDMGSRSRLFLKNLLNFFNNPKHQHWLS